jgi:phage gpG-like protein
MSGVVIDVTLDGGFGRASRQIGNLAALNRTLVLDGLGQLGEMQTKRRIATEKTAPDGAAWRPNRAGTSILVQQGYLRDSIHHAVEGSSSVRWGSPLVYAAIHQAGGTILPTNGRFLVFRAGGRTIFAQRVTIPARPYLGISAANRVQMERHLLTMIGRQLNG